jgi:hypothetical protein
MCAGNMVSSLPGDGPKSLFVFKMTFYLIGVPLSTAERGTYMDLFQRAIRSVLSMSQEWLIQMSELEGPVEARSLTPSAKVDVAFTGRNVSPVEGRAMESKARDPSTILQLNQKGFRVSLARLPVSVLGNSSELSNLQLESTGQKQAFNATQGPSILTVATASAAGALVCIAAGVSYFYCGQTKAKSKLNNEEKTKQMLAQAEQDRNSISEDAACSEESNLNPLKSTKADALKDRFKSEDQEESTATTAAYSSTIDDITQILARAGVGIEHLVDLHLRKQLKANLLGSNGLSRHDHSAILQMIEFTDSEIDQGKFAGSEHCEALETRAAAAKSAKDCPLTEAHLRMLRIICRPDRALFLESGAMSADGGQRRNALQKDQMVRDETSRFESDGIMSSRFGESMTGDKEILEPEGKALNSLMLSLTRFLHKFELQPSYILHKECRELIELNLVSRKDGLSSDQKAILQMLSKAEMDSDAWPLLSPERKALLEERVKRGPLSSRHLDAVSSLETYDLTLAGDPKLLVIDQPPCDAEPPTLASAVLHSEGATSKPVAEPAQPEGSPGTALDRVLPLLDSFSGMTPESESSGRIEGKDAYASSSGGRAPFFDAAISGLEVTSLLSPAERALLQQMELKAKTDRIRRSIPDWVRQGLLPPLQFRPLAAPPGAQSSPVLISSAVRADLGFLGVAMEAPRPPRSLARGDSGPLARLSIGEQPDSEPACVAAPGPVRPITGEEVQFDLPPKPDAQGPGERRGPEAAPWGFTLLRLVRSLGACVWDVVSRWCGKTEAARGGPCLERGDGVSA